MKGMKNIFISLGTFLFLSSCGLLFTTNESGAVTPLALTGGAQLSTDDHNEICPFLVRMMDGSAYLFYSSDQNGSYDIWAAKMNPDGNFGTPVRLGSPVNSDSSNETFPVVQQYGQGFRVTLLRILNTFTNVYSYYLDTNFISTAPADDILTSAKSLGLIKRPDNEYLLMANGNLSVPSWYDMNGRWDTIDTTVISNANVVALNGIAVSLSNNDYIQLYIEETLINGKHSLSAEGIFMHSITNFPYVTNLPFNISTPDYQSKYNDITPFIDYAGGFKVYFASDRYGKDNYDLYRYNIYTYNKLPEVQQVFAYDTVPPSITNMSFIDGQMFSTGPNSMMLSVTDNIGGSGVFGVYYSLNSSAFIEIPYSNGYSTFINIVIGNNVIKTYAVDNAWNFSKTNSMTIIGK
jgi:hypothetical protein